MCETVPNNCQHINIMLIGSLSSGKSSFANTLKTALRVNCKQVDTTCVVHGKNYESVTSKVGKIQTRTMLAHLSYSDRLLSVVRPSVPLSVRLSVNFLHFHFLFQNPRAIFNQTWHKVSVGGGNSVLFKWRIQPFSKER